MLDRAALCWQEDEITGHDIDTLSGDDGLGINGVGFKPTPAIAQERLARRRRQIFEWKAREAREARQKRIDRRCGRGGEKSHEGPPKRTVRFAA
ncbi:hypothetical protein K470DRAFT_257720 [Piedraia hortae CBS 480.64]|uniref:Uncharacterized protein n=1 Tax=Piedraia hortae CBS 480.64 TaxID=1314780 RepID=A0A6A7BZS1_9PEZI|nr:hypothetical protein K470DRAFT_257720 [Piedraia hortae CBS 480.64]